MMDKIGRKLGLKDDTGWDDPSVVGFIVIWGIFGYGLYVVVSALSQKITWLGYASIRSCNLTVRITMHPAFIYWTLLYNR